jgi:hypothetical protein
MTTPAAGKQIPFKREKGAVWGVHEEGVASHAQAAQSVANQNESFRRFLRDLEGKDTR